MTAVKADNIYFSYRSYSEEDDRPESVSKALDGLSIEIGKGEYVAVLGPNGSGKSTLAKLIDVLGMPDEGKLAVLGYDSKDRDHFWDIRENCAYVFQNPDNQLIGTIVEEDVAFGPENLGVPLPELRERVDRALEYVGLKDLAKRQTATLSGGQKQKLAVAGALAMEPEILILDESTSMLDPQSREELLEIVGKINREKKTTVINITHDMNEAAGCDRAFVIENGKVTLSGRPCEIFADRKAASDAGLMCPVYVDLAFEIAALAGKESLDPDTIKNEETCSDFLSDLLLNISASCEVPAPVSADDPARDVILSVRNLDHTYENSEEKVLDDFSLDIMRGEILAVVGRSGCGKTTLISHLNGILKPSSGDVVFFTPDKRELHAGNKKDLRELRKHVGLLFQYPEYQLFEETIYKDIGYGLKMLDIDEKDRDKLIRQAADAAGFPQEMLDRSPFEMSGGRKRRAAIAGVLVMKPDVLVLDEPASGLDPRGRIEMFSMLGQLKAAGTTIVLVSHNMDEAQRYADRICIIRDGKAAVTGRPGDIFENEGKARSLGLAMPSLFVFSEMIQKKTAAALPGILWEKHGRTPADEAAAMVRSIIRYRREHDV